MPEGIAEVCEFCEELFGRTSRFSRIYGSEYRTRIVDEFKSFVAMPTIGQLVPGSLLLLPKTHVETLAQLGDDDISNLETFVNRLLPAVAELGIPLLFEHGARRDTESGCGIYHAHLHLVPAPSPVGFELFFKPSARRAPDLTAAFRRLRTSSNYLVCRDTQGCVAFDEISVDGAPFSSQFVRRKLASHLALPREWDWRAYARPEPLLIDAIRHFGSRNVSECA